MRHIAFISILFALISCAPSRNPPPYYSKDYINREPDIQMASRLEKEANDLIQADQHKKAILKLTRIITKYPEYNHLYRVYNARAIAYHKSDKYKKALADYKRALLLYPHYVNAYLSMGLLYKHMNMAYSAEKMFKKCIEILPDKKDYFMKLIVDLYPLVRASFGPKGVYYHYKYYKAYFKLKNMAELNVFATNVPHRPFKIKRAGDDSFEMHIFTMDFKNIKNYKKLFFKQRMGKWIKIELGVFKRTTGIPFNKVSPIELEINNRRCALVELKSYNKKYAFLFFFIRDFGIMLFLKSDMKRYAQNLKYLKDVAKNIS